MISETEIRKAYDMLRRVDESEELMERVYGSGEVMEYMGAQDVLGWVLGTGCDCFSDYLDDIERLIGEAPSALGTIK